MVIPHYAYKLTASWADMDFNAHMANTAYLNRAVDARMAFFTENGLPLAELFKVRNDFFRADGQLAAKVTSTGGFLDLDARKLVAPPIEILTTYQAMPRADDYEDLPSSLKTKAS